MSTGDNLPRQFVRYVVAGGAAVSTHLAVLSALIEWADFHKTAASVIGFSCAIPINYILQHRFVFARRGRHWTFFTRYIGVTLAALGLNAIVFWTMVEVAGIHYLVAQTVAIALVFIANFLASRLFTFARYTDGLAAK